MTPCGSRVGHRDSERRTVAPNATSIEAIALHRRVLLRAVGIWLLESDRDCGALVDAETEYVRPRIMSDDIEIIFAAR